MLAINRNVKRPEGEESQVVRGIIVAHAVNAARPVIGADGRFDARTGLPVAARMKVGHRGQPTQ